MLVDGRTGVEVIEERECLTLLAAEVVGRVAVIEGGAPLVLPVNYAVDGSSIVFRTDAGSKLDAARGGAACFEIDSFDREHHGGWSVVVRGRLELVTARDQPTLERVGDLAEPWIAGRPTVVRLVPWSITGRRLRPTAADPAPPPAEA